MPPSPELLRTEAFGTRTYFASKKDRLVTAAKLALLRVLKSEEDARSLGSLHFASWVLVPRRKMERLRQLRARVVADPAARDQMLFMSDFSGDWEVYLVGFNRVLLSALDLAWGNSVGWRSPMELKDYLRFVEAHELRAQAYYSPYAHDASVSDVRSALLLSDEVERFAFEVADTSAERFGDAFRRLRIRLGTGLSA